MAIQVRTNAGDFERWATVELRKVLNGHLEAKRAAFGATFDDLVERSPVSDQRTRPAGGHGQFRFSWMPTNDAPSFTDPAPMPRPFFPVPGAERIVPVVQSMRLGSRSYIVNVRPYANRLAHGWSKQAPSGWVHAVAMRAESRYRMALNRRLAGMKRGG